MKRNSLRANISETVLVLLINEQGEKEKGRDERKFSWCCSFSREFGCRGTERRLAWRAAAEWSGSQNRRRFFAGLAAGSRSGRETQAAHLHRGIQTGHSTGSRSRRCDTRRYRSSPAPGRLVLLAAGNLAARAGRWNPRGVDSAEARAEVQAQSTGRRKSEAATPERTSRRRSTQSAHHHRRSKKSGCAVGPSDNGTGPGGELLMAAGTELATAVGTRAACRALFAPRASHYRKRHAPIWPVMTRTRPSPPRALAPAERETVWAHLHGARFQDRSPAAVYATLLDEAAYLCSIRSLY